MPELPDVVIFKRYLQATALYQKIEAVEEVSTPLLDGISAKQLRKNLLGRSFEDADRHGKYLFARVAEDGWLVLHFGMSGFLKYFKNTDQAPAHVRLLIAFTNGYHLAYDCSRKLGRVSWTTDRKRFIDNQQLGPDALAEKFDEEVFRSLLDKRRGSIKSLLMNQQALAGIGNIYSDEILFHADIHPRRKAANLQEADQQKLYHCLRKVLQTAIDRHAGENGWPDDWLLPVRSSSQTCPRCGGEIRRSKISGRSSYFCASHQSRC